ncbi:hypothetical protein ACOME3_001513 [Neoechinorhynchus agilis]
MNLQLFFLSFLFGLQVYGNSRPSDQCISIDTTRVNFAIQCGSSHDNATTLIEVLNLKANESVVRLSIAGIGIDEIPTNLPDVLPKVTTLRLRYPPSTKFGICTGECTNKFYNIEVLELIDMNLYVMEFNNSLPNLKRLRILGGEMTKLDDSFKTKIPNLELLLIMYSKLSNLGAIKNICSLRNLFLEYNKITSLDIDNATCFQNLIELTLHGNAIDSVTIDHGALPQLKCLLMDFYGDLNQLIRNLKTPKLKILSVRKTNSTIFNVSNLENLPKLKDLYFEEGKLERVPIGNQQTKENVLLLSLKNNNISIVSESDFEGWKKVRKLYLNQNNIKKLSSNSFSKMVNLRVLDLRFNSIAELHTDAFQGVPKNIRLYFQGNPMSTIPPHIFKIHKRKRRQ